MLARAGSIWHKGAGASNSSDLTSTSRWRTLIFYLDCAGIGFLFGLLTLLIRTENREPRGVHSPHNPHNHSELEGVSGPEGEVLFHSKEEETQKGKNNLISELAEKGKVLCWVMTGPDNHQAKVKGKGLSC